MAPAPSSPRPLRYTDLPRMSRQVPQTELLHTIYFKRITYPFSDRLAELWIVEVDTEGHEQWRTVESFLQNMGHPRDDLTLRQSANQWRRFYDIPERDHSTSPHQQYPILPHPCHSNFPRQVQVTCRTASTMLHMDRFPGYATICLGLDATL